MNSIKTCNKLKIKFIELTKYQKIQFGEHIFIKQLLKKYLEQKQLKKN